MDYIHIRTDTVGTTFFWAISQKNSFTLSKLDRPRMSRQARFKRKNHLFSGTNIPSHKNQFNSVAYILITLFLFVSVTSAEVTTRPFLKAVSIVERAREREK